MDNTAYKNKISSHLPDCVMLTDKMVSFSAALIDPMVDDDDVDSTSERWRQALVFVPDGLLNENSAPETIYIEEMDTEGTWLKFVKKEDINPDHIVHEVAFQKYYTRHWNRNYDKKFGMKSIYVNKIGDSEMQLAVKPDTIPDL